MNRQVKAYVILIIISFLIITNILQYFRCEKVLEIAQFWRDESSRLEGQLKKTKEELDRTRTFFRL
jgi:hypothetical protein